MQALHIHWIPKQSKRSFLLLSFNQFLTYMEIVLQIADKHAPLRLRKVRSEYTPLLTILC